MASYCCKHPVIPFQQKLHTAASLDFDNALEKLSKTTDNLHTITKIIERTYATSESETIPPPIDLSLSPNFQLTYNELKTRNDLRTGPLTCDLYQEDRLFFSRQLNQPTKESISFNRHYKKTYVLAESLNLENFEDTNSAQVMGSDTSKTLASALDDKIYLDDFFKRPVIIDVRGLNLNTNIDFVLDPWALWSDLPSVRNKLAHFAYFRGNLKLRFNLSTSKFHYGSLMASYQPLSANNRNYLVMRGLSPITDQKRLFRSNYLSQSPDLCYINAGQDDDVQLDLPYVHPQQSLRLFNAFGASILDNISSYEDFLDLGQLFVTSLRQLHSQNVAETDQVVLTVYAWMEDVEISTPTNTRITVTAESEYTTNPISSVATSVANIAEKLSDVPIISTFAKATHIAATAISKVALMFGFSKPIIVEPVSFAKQVTFANGATIIGRDTAYKLTCDPKQELSLMNDIMGSGSHDPLAHKTITSIPSLLDVLTMTDEAQPYLHTYLTLPITPMLGTHFVNTSSTTTRQMMMNSSLAQVAMNYTYWRGTVSFRFDVTAPNFTRGKLIFIYEPNGNDSLIDRQDRTTIINQQYIVTMDLEKERSITVHVGFNHHKAFANVHQTPNNKGMLRPYLNQSGDPTSEIIASNQRGQSTGVITIRAATSITGLTVAAPMYINTYVYSDDMEFAEPWDHSVNTLNSNVNAESAYEQGEPLNKVQRKIDNKIDVSGKEIIINRTIPSNNNIFTAHFGEKIESLRVLLKRDQVAFRLAHITANSVVHPVYPPPNTLLIPKSVALTGDVGRVNTFNIMRYCYLGVRGGMRYRIISRSDPFLGNLVIKYTKTRNFNPQGLVSSMLQDNVAPSVSGTIVQSTVHGGVEYEVPYYSPHLFDTPCAYNEYDRYDRPKDISGVLIHADLPGALPTQVYLMSIAEDFNFLRYQGSCFYNIDPITNTSFDP